MPFIYDMTSPEALDEDFDFAPSVEQFAYLPPPEYYNVPQPIQFSILPPETEEPEPMPPARPAAMARPFSIAGLFGRRKPLSEKLVQQRKAYFDERQRREYLRHEWRTRKLFSIVVPALKAAGVRSVYCRYDGGNDEGFAWFDHYATVSGALVAADLVGEKLQEIRIGEMLPKIVTNLPNEAGALGHYIGGILSHYWSSMLLGSGFGTGEYVMYGAFIADLDKCTIIDDPKADPVVENIQVKA